MPLNRVLGEFFSVLVGRADRRGRSYVDCPDTERRRLLQRYFIVVMLLVSSGLTSVEADAEDRAGPIRIGALTESWGPTPSVMGLRNGLVEMGYRENEHFFIGVRFTQGDIAALPGAARELVQLGVDILFVSTASPAKAAQMATTRIPIVFGGVSDPVGLGLIESFARPGRNITGVTDLALELNSKRLEVFREVVPSLKRVLFVYDSAEAYAVAEVERYRDAAQRLGIVLVEKPLRTQEEAQATLAGVRKGDVDGILAPRTVSLNIPGFVLEAGSQRAIPAMFPIPFFVQQGGLVSYGSDIYESSRRAARLVDKILKGADPGEIPVEVNPKVELVINLKAAEALGLSIAPEVLYRADRLIR